jgi:hypothetical protein
MASINRPERGSRVLNTETSSHRSPGVRLSSTAFPHPSAGEREESMTLDVGESFSKENCL